MPKRFGEKISGTVGRLRDIRNSRKDFRKALVCRTIDFELSSSKSDAAFRIAHLTDMHVGRVTPMQLQQAAIDLVNETEPDFVMLTGDFVCHSELFLEDLTFLLNQIKAPSFAVLGNHDHWTNALAVKKALRKAGVEVLENENTIVEIRNAKLQIVGVDDPYTKHDDVLKATKGLTKGIHTIGLSHIAEAAEQLWKFDVDLVLAGHTHAGQVTVAGLNELLLGKIGGQKYIHGLYQNPEPGHSHQFVYVGAGVGSAIIPFRFGEKAKREVTVFELKTPK